MNKEFKTSCEKLEYVNQYLDKLMSIAEISVKRSDYNRALSALATYCKIQYSINQEYTDEKAENLIQNISRKFITVSDDYKTEKGNILFYDGFGLDLRGWAASFARALSNCDYKVIYVAPAHAKLRIPHIISEIESGNGVMEYIGMNNSYLESVDALNKIFKHYKPQVAFFYTTPNDVSGTTVFNAYAGKITRIQIDLTDHAFWIGAKAIDFCTESRVIGVSNAIYHRKISKEMIFKIDGCPYINKDIDETPLPFDIEKEKYVFSGGSLYKTLGDEGLYYYRIVNHILSNHREIKFLFAGGGDDTEIKKLIKKYPDRMFYIGERADFIRLFQNCLFFLNTYPMFGGLMMRYAAMVGKIPLTLKHSSDHEGILKDQDKMEIEFDSLDEVVKEADRLIDNQEYRKKKENGLIGSVITEDEFRRNIQLMIDEGKTIDTFGDVKPVDTTHFRSEYLERLNPEDLILKSIANKKNISLLRYFPELFAKRAIRRI